MYANPNTVMNSNIKAIMDMGFSEDDSKLEIGRAHV